MGFGDLRALALDLNLAVHGVACTVTTPTGDPVETRGIWVTPLNEGFPSNLSVQRTEPTRVLVLSRAVCPTLPRGTAIVAPEQDGGTPRAWRVDGLERVEADHQRAIVILDRPADLVLEEDEDA